MQNIEEWLNKFKNYWENGDIEAVLSLFGEEVVYFETPFQNINNKKELKEEWLSIDSQTDINLTYEIFSKDKNKYSVLWQLDYIDENNNKKEFAGTYLIELGKNGLCIYFHHTCESKS